MRHELLQNLKSRPATAIAILVMLLVCIFVADTITNLEIAVAVFYVVVILLAVSLLPPRGVIVVAGASIGLTLLSIPLTPSEYHEAGLINGGLSIAAIGITIYLALKMVTAEAAAHEARAQLTRISRIRSLGELTASIAHEVNQPLAAIVTSGNACLRWLDMAPPNVERAKKAVERLIGDANRASEIITRVRGLAQNEIPHKHRLYLNEAIIETVALARSEIDRSEITLRINLTDSLPPVLADKVQLQQVIGNLILNAVEAIGMGQSQHRTLDISSHEENAEKKVVFAIADSGIGLEPAMAKHLFDAFWTTKEGGIGLGLTISRSIIEAHGGRIWATPAPHGGAVFQFSLPSAEEQVT